MVYYQESGWQEDGWGQVVLRFVVSDSYSELFNISSGINVKIFDLTKISKGLKGKSGGLIESEIEFEINETIVNLTNEKNALIFVKEAQDPSEIRFVAIFIDPSGTTALPSELLTYGIVQTDYKSTHIKWTGPQFTDNPTMLKRYTFNAKPYNTGSIAGIELKDLIYGNVTNLVTGIDSTWENANVLDRQGYFLWADRGNRGVNVFKLVGLNELLRKLSDNLTQTLIDKGLGTLNIEFNESILDGRWHPARWVMAESPAFDSYDPDSSHYYPRYNYTVKYLMENGVEIYPSTRGKSCWFTYSSDYVQLIIDPDGTPDETSKIYFSYALVKKCATGENIEINDPLTDPNESLRFYSKCKNYMEFIEKLALNFGCYASVQLTEANTLTIEFISRSNFSNTNIYFKRVRAAREDITNIAIEKTENEQFTIKALSISDEGRKRIVKEISGNVIYRQNQNDDEYSDSNDLLLSISPTVVIAQYGMDPEDDSHGYDYVMFPYNTYFASNNVEEDKEYGKSPGLHTAIYVNVSKDTDPVHDSYQNTDHLPDTYFTPIGSLSVRIEGSDQSYDTLSEYIKKINVNDEKYLHLELNIEVPYYYGFSDDGGITLDWKFANIRNTFNLGSQGYIIESVEWKTTEPLVTIKTSASAKYDYGIPVVSPIPDQDEFITNADPEIKDNNLIIDKIAGENLDAFQVVSIKDDSTVEASLPHEDHHRRVYGITLSSVLSGERVKIQTTGVVEIPGDWDDLVPGSRLFLRYDPISPINIAFDILQGFNSVENMVVEIGKAVSARYFKITEDFPIQSVLDIPE